MSTSSFSPLCLPTRPRKKRMESMTAMIELTATEMHAARAAVDRERLHTLACIQATGDASGRDERWLQALERLREKLDAAADYFGGVSNG